MPETRCHRLSVAFSQLTAIDPDESTREAIKEGITGVLLLIYARLPKTHDLSRNATL
jgi:hypothetical protein